jgi:glutamyl-tRNA synthetase
MVAVRTRFAPSPTGFLHIGGARTALFSWAYARRFGGRFVLRIEDTDRERSTAESEAVLIDGLRWLGIDWDEGPFRQSERGPRHQAVIEELLAKGRAYRCSCTREALEIRKAATIADGRKWTYDGRCRDAALGPDCGPHTVRLRLDPEGALAWEDLVFGPSGQDAREIGDMIIRRSDGGPLYNLAVVVDDVDMGITHVIRGADHHSNTPFQIAIYRAMEAAQPRFAHVPLIVGRDGKKLSKRRDQVSVQQFRADGHPVDAMRNWLVRIGWSHGDQEIFSREEIAAHFDLDAVHRASAQADPGKLSWLSQHYLKTLPREVLFAELQAYLDVAAGHPVPRSAALERLVDLLRERSHSLSEMAALARFFLVQDVAYDAKAAEKHLRKEIEPALAALHDQLAQLETWDAAHLESIFETVRTAHGNVPLAKLAQPVRVAVTGGAVSPPIFDTLEVLGKARSVSRIAEALHFVRHGG